MDLSLIYDHWAIILLVVFCFALGRYLFLAGTAWLFCYKPGLKKLQQYKIQKRHASRKQLRNELLFSLSTITIFSLVGLAVCWLYRHGYTTLYTDAEQYGRLYLLFSILLMIVVHDAYFYWTHRLLHRPWLMRHIHIVHHRSTNPTPWAAYAFHPLEAVIESFVVFPFITIFPVHMAAFLFFTFLVLVMNVMGHLGYEFFPKKIRRGPVGKHFTSSTHHNLHHSKVHSNFGYYFTFWDKWMKTLHRDS
jgi:Delta7-sterol 5-desaturase